MSMCIRAWINNAWKSWNHVGRTSSFFLFFLKLNLHYLNNINEDDGGSDLCGSSPQEIQRHWEHSWLVLLPHLLASASLAHHWSCTHHRSSTSKAALDKTSNTNVLIGLLQQIRVHTMSNTLLGWRVWSRRRWEREEYGNGRSMELGGDWSSSSSSISYYSNVSKHKWQFSEGTWGPKRVEGFMTWF